LYDIILKNKYWKMFSIGKLPANNAYPKTTLGQNFVISITGPPHKYLTKKGIKKWSNSDHCFQFFNKN
jgi:hypothetical protein